MGATLAEVILKLITELNFRRAFGACFFVALVGVAFWGFEKQSSWLALTKLERCQKLIGEIVAVERGGTIDPASRALEDKIRREVESIVAPAVPNEGNPALARTPPVVHKGFLTAWLLGAAPWVLLLLAALISSPRLGPKEFSAVAFTAAGIASISGFVNYYLPLPKDGWWGVIVGPLLAALATGGIFGVAGVASISRQISRVKVIENNLRKLSAALDQFALENGVNSATFDQLVGPDKYVKELRNIAGEDYRSLRLNTDEKVWRVTTAEGKAVELNRV